MNIEERLKGVEAEFQAYRGPHAKWVWLRGACYFVGMASMLASYGLIELDSRTNGHGIDIELPFPIKIAPLIFGITLLVLTIVVSGVVKRARKKQRAL